MTRLGSAPVRFASPSGFASALGLAALLALLPASPARAQGVTLPPSGDNQKAVVTQYMGPASVTVEYHSPDVHAPDGSDRHGKIWGGLVHYGYSEENFGTCGKKCPWRGGANENTTVTFSHPVTVEGKPLAAGTYGLHFLAGEKEWTVIFSKVSTAWGSYFYDESNDALRVNVKSAANPYHEWLTYDFEDRQPASTVLALEWEDLKVPVAIALPNENEIYYQTLRRELESSPGFDYHGWQQAADFLAEKKVHLDDAEKWAQTAVSAPFIGEENFQTLQSLSNVQRARGKTAEADATMAKAIGHPSASPTDIYQYARPMIRDGKPKEALAIFQNASKRMPNKWPLDLGIARSYSAMGDYKSALKYAKQSLLVAPDGPNKDNVQRMIAKLEKGEDMNKQ
jgi:tetratricopeptide (TPR) repeat protein